MRKTALGIGSAVAIWLALTAQTSPPAATQEVHATLNQLMRGVVYPAANVVFSPQFNDPGVSRPAPDDDPAMATDPLVSVFGGWQAVENASLALTESANLLLMPGRVCSNGAPVPIADPAWSKFVLELRDAGLQAYAAAKAEDRDKMIELSSTVNDACVHCHRKWRPRVEENRCK
ncbi:MAG TPA: hypothetical protein VFV10_12270 [Gammaproteobacteria bacterium]|nr:hypothetical protein [Gammaproteobacteria bacterium]